jgi:hypothetical protein
MIIINKKASYLLMASVLLTACVSVKSFNVRQITADKLADGTPVTLGSIPVKNEWQCTQIGQTSFGWKKAEVEAEYTDWGNYNGFVKKKALDYANEHKLDPNYIYHHIPMDVSAGVVQNYNSDVQIIYYKCVNPPKANHDVGAVL